MTGIRGFEAEKASRRHKKVPLRINLEAFKVSLSFRNEREEDALSEALKLVMKVSGRKSATRHLEKRRRRSDRGRNVVAGVQLFGSTSHSNQSCNFQEFETEKFCVDQEKLLSFEVEVGTEQRCQRWRQAQVQMKRNAEALGRKSTAKCNQTSGNNWEQDQRDLLAPEVSFFAGVATRKATVDASQSQSARAAHFQVIDHGTLNDRSLSPAVPMSIKLEPSLRCIILSNQARVMEPQLIDYQLEE